MEVDVQGQRGLGRQRHPDVQGVGVRQQIIHDLAVERRDPLRREDGPALHTLGGPARVGLVAGAIRGSHVRPHPVFGTQADGQRLPRDVPALSDQPARSSFGIPDPDLRGLLQHVYRQPDARAGLVAPSVAAPRIPDQRHPDQSGLVPAPGRGPIEAQHPQHQPGLVARCIPDGRHHLHSLGRLRLVARRTVDGEEARRLGCLEVQVRRPPVHLDLGPGVRSRGLGELEVDGHGRSPRSAVQCAQPQVVGRLPGAGPPVAAHEQGDARQRGRREVEDDVAQVPASLVAGQVDELGHEREPPVVPRPALDLPAVREAPRGLVHSGRRAEVPLAQQHAGWLGQGLGDPKRDGEELPMA